MLEKSSGYLQAISACRSRGRQSASEQAMCRLVLKHGLAGRKVCRTEFARRLSAGASRVEVVRPNLR